MVFVSLQILLLIVCVVFMFLENEEGKNDTYKMVYAVICIAMFLLVGFRPIGIDNDSDNYVVAIQNAGILEDYEPSFRFISWLTYDIMDSVRMLFVIFAFLSVTIKAFALIRISNLAFTSVVIWLSHFYLMHDATQIRVSVSIGLFFVGLYYLYKGNKKAYVLWILVSVLFHYSALLLLPIALLGNKPFNKTWLTLLLVIPLLGYIMAALHLDPLDFIPGEAFQQKKEAYDRARESGIMNMDEINVFNVGYLLHVVIYYFFLLKREIISKHCPYFPLMMKLFGLSLICYTALSFLPVMAFRVSELFGSIEIILFPYLIYTVRPLWVGKVMIALYAFLMLSVDLFMNQIITMN